MVHLPEGYSIDSTEVTRAEYAAWLDTSPSTEGQISDCTWNTTFAPATSCMSWTAVCRTDCDHHPQVCVDWCDAYAYCQAVGKRLCGRIGGGWSMWTDYTDASLSEWYNACSSHGVNTYPYGNVYDGQLCNGSDYTGTTHMTVAVGTLPACQSSNPGHGGVFDLNGNVGEWENACSGAGRLANCRVRGGSFYTGSNVTCAINLFNARSFAHEGIGIRCCSTP
jgi:formylglycine-generating enzyme required for sulfatase activity